jgi:hypothetical protein
MAILFDDKIYCHMPKTGGAWTTAYLQKKRGGAQTPDHGHHPAADIPKESLEGRTLFGTIRNPWDWYASWYMHAKSRAIDKDGLFRFGAGSDSFKSVMIGAIIPDPGQAPDNIGVIWAIKDPRKAREEFLNQGCGLYTWVFHHVYSGMVKTFIDTPQLHEGLSQITGVAISPKKHPATNTRHQRPESAVDDVRALYDQEPRLIDLIWETDGDIIKAMGYTEPFGKAPTPVIQLDET